jgi:hypothetical protein
VLLEKKIFCRGLSLQEQKLYEMIPAKKFKLAYLDIKKNINYSPKKNKFILRRFHREKEYEARGLGKNQIFIILKFKRWLYTFFEERR